MQERQLPKIAASLQQCDGLAIKLNLQYLHVIAGSCSIYSMMQLPWPWQCGSNHMPYCRSEKCLQQPQAHPFICKRHDQMGIQDSTMTSMSAQKYSMEWILVKMSDLHSPSFDEVHFPAKFSCSDDSVISQIDLQ